MATQSARPSKPRKGDALAAESHLPIADILQGMGGGFALWSKDLKLLICNDAYRGMFSGTRRTPKPGDSFEEVARLQSKMVVGAARNNAKSWITRQKRLRRQAAFEDELQLSNGRWLSVTGSKTRGNYVTELVTDVTAIKEGELESAQLAQRNAQMAVAISSMQSGVIITNPNLTDNPVVYANPAFVPPNGSAKKSVLGMPLEEIFDHGVQEDARAEVSAAVAKGKSARVVLERKNHGGQSSWAELRLNPVLGGDRQINYFIGIETDITAQKRSELDLQKRVARQAAVAELGNKALLGGDLDELMEDAVRMTAEVLGLKYVTVLELAPSGKEMSVRAAVGWPKKAIAESKPGLPVTRLLSRMFKAEAPTVIRRTPAQLKASVGLIKARNLRFSAGIQIAGREAPFGALAVHDKEPRDLDPDDLSFFESVAYVLGVAVERSQTEDALRHSQHRFELAVKGSNDGIWDWDIEKDQYYFSSRWRAMLGLQNGEMEESLDAWLERIHDEDRETFESALKAHLDDKTQYLACEHRLLHEDGSYRWMLARGLAVRDRSGKATRIAGSISDITETKRAEYELLKDALHDTLTGLPNRALFNDRLTQALVRVSRNPEHLFGVLYLDFDRFKVINDSLGHSYGDQILIEIGHRLKECTREVDTVARLGGDEFAILLENLESEIKAEDVARRINHMMAEPFDLAGRQIVSNASIGIALSSLGYHDPEEIVRDADIAMYQAKTQGRGRHIVFEKGMHLRAVTQLEMETDLRRAIDNEEFTLAFQPVVDIRNNRTAGFEALVRWNHPDRGFVPPGDFIPIAEETKLIIPMGRLILRMACAQMRKWSDQFPKLKLSMSVNISPEQFADPSLIEDVTGALKDSGIAGEQLKVEITEGAIMENPHEVTNRLLQLRKMGIQLHVDDFGTGYSSLSHLHRFPIDALKVDRSFVISMAESEDNMEIVRTIIDLAHNLKLSTVAEGVETKRDLQQLKKLKCDHAQGFYFSKPMDAKKATAYIKKEIRGR